VPEIATMMMINDDDDDDDDDDAATTARFDQDQISFEQGLIPIKLSGSRNVKLPRFTVILLGKFFPL
jgi:hypothetical protein